MKLRTKILSLGGINICIQVITLIIILTIFSSLLTGFGNIIDKANTNQRLTEESQNGIASAGNLVEQMVVQMADLNKKIVSTNANIKVLEKKIVASSKDLSTISQTIEDVLDTIEDEDTQDLLFDMADGVGNLQEIMKREALVSLQSSVKSMDESTLKMSEQLENINVISSNLVQLKENGIKVTEQSSEILSISALFAESIQKNKIFLSGLILLFALGAILIGFFISRSITIPLMKVIDRVKDIAEGEGDLTQRLDDKRKDELGELSGWFNTFLKRLNDIIVNITTNAETVTASSVELSSVSEEISGGTDELFTNANTVAAASEEMSSNMDSVAAASEEAATNISMVSDSASQMQQTLGEVAQNCDRARNISGDAASQVENALERVSRLGNAAKDITKVTEVITDIAEQTNLLALNATIEAARAGEAGKGFAVVASEIKSLSAQTANATNNIREKIGSMQRSTDDTVSDVTDFAKVIGDVDEIVTTIAAAVEEQSASATEVAENIEQATKGIIEVNGNVLQSSEVSSNISKDIAGVNHVAENMSNRSSRLNQSSSELSVLASKLRDMISVFKVSIDADETGTFSDTQADRIADLIPWGPGLELGFTPIDTQHKDLVKMLNHLHKSMKMSQGTRQTGKILTQLMQYTQNHFKFEEDLFADSNYPDAKSHTDEHLKLIEKVVDFQSRLKQGDASVAMDLMQFLKEWLKTHILKTDRAFVDFHVSKMQNK